jgi:hypothetical protein
MTRHHSFREFDGCWYRWEALLALLARRPMAEDELPEATD